ncbi:MAG: bifunctional adenosylcobinamide kinase/adenosylcobinamide-phosphate guanylyltransferase [Ilumatobacteraceae bacterium]|jgi:adenosyl cobinamide kinase/adenosyl cobinamide phosphate guanylyltransferase
MAVTILLGGARSGKSSLAVEIGRRHDGDVTFIATAEPFDDDMRERIDAHRADRPEWSTVEAPLDLGPAIRAAPDASLVIVDCVTVWMGNLFAHDLGPAQRKAACIDLMTSLVPREGPTVVVTNEVGLGLHPETALGREYRDELGRLNQGLVDIADHALLLVAGRAIPLSDPWEHLS